MTLRRVVLVVALLVSLAVVAGGPVAARHPPISVCQVCGNGLTTSAAEHGLAVSPGESTLTIQVFENGTSRWTARVELTTSSANESNGPETTSDQYTSVRESRIKYSGSAAIEALRTDDSLRCAVVSDAREWDLLETPKNVTSTVSDRTLVVRYWRPSAVERSSGTLVFDAFDLDHPDRAAPLYGGADRVLLDAPEGYRIVDGPTGEAATANATTAVWAGGTDTSDYWQGPSIDYTTVKFAPNTTPTADASANGRPGSFGQFGWVAGLLGVVVMVLVGLVLVAARGSGRGMDRE